MKPLKNISDYIIDTTMTSTSTLKERITNLFLGNMTDGMTIQCMSFGFKYGCVSEADIVFDVRCLKTRFMLRTSEAIQGLKLR